MQRMVISLSSDKAVWDAVLNNEVVKELRGSISEEGSSFYFSVLSPCQFITINLFSFIYFDRADDQHSMA